MARKIFVNIPVRDLSRSMEFFRKLGFEFNPNFTDETAACMVLSEDGYVMLLRHDRFKDFVKRPVGDPSTSTSAIFALSAESRAEVDRLVETALEAGGSRAGDPVDHGFMYYWSFFDIDGHHWEVLHMDPAAIPPTQ